MNPVLRMTLPESKSPALRAYDRWVNSGKYSPDIFATFMTAFEAGRKEGFAEGCEHCIGLEPIERVVAPKVPTVDDLRRALNNPWSPKRLCDLIRGKR